MLLQTGKLQKSARAAILQKDCKLRTNTSLHTHLQELQTTFLNCTETHHCKVSTCTLAPLLLLRLELLQELQPASLAAAKPPNYTALQLHSKLQTPCMKTSAANTASANCIAWPQPGLHLCTRGLPSHSTSRLQRSCICFLVRSFHAVSLQWLQRFHLCKCTSGWKRHRLHLHCLHPIFNDFLIEIQYTAIVFNRAQRAPVEVFSMHPAFSNGFLIEIQYTAIVFNRAQRAPVEVFSMYPAFSNGFLIEIQYTAIGFNRAQRAPMEVFSMYPAFSNGFLIEIQYTAINFNRAQRAPVEVFSMHPAFLQWLSNRDSIHCYCF